MKIEKDVIESLTKIFEKCNFNELQIKKLIINYSYYANKETNLENKINRYKKVLMDWGYSESDAIDIIVENPRYINSTSEWIKNHKDIILKNRNTRTKLMVKSIEKVKCEEIDCEPLLNEMLNFGFDQDTINYLRFHSISALMLLTVEDFYDRINFFLNYGLTKDELIKRISKDFYFIYVDEKFFNDRFKFFSKFKISPQEFMEMYIKSYQGIRADISHLQEIINWFYKFQFNDMQIRKIILKQPTVFNASSDIYTPKFNNLLKYGFNNEEIRRLITKCPTYLSNSTSLVDDKIDLLFKYGYSDIDVKRILLGYPEYITMSKQNLIDKLNVIFSNKLDDYVVKKPKNLIQSANLTEMRVWFLTSYHKLNLSLENNFKRYQYLVYLNKKDFNNMFKLEDDTLEDLYLQSNFLVLTK